MLRSTHATTSLTFRSPLARYANMSAHDAPKAAETDAQAADAANTSGVTSETLQKRLEEQLGAQHVEIQDMSGNLASCLTF